jgi:hypothetical protein
MSNMRNKSQSILTLQIASTRSMVVKNRMSPDVVSSSVFVVLRRVRPPLGVGHAEKNMRVYPGKSFEKYSKGLDFRFWYL